MASTLYTAGRATTHAQTPLCALNRSKRVMRRAQEIRRDHGVTMREALCRSWAVEKLPQTEGARQQQQIIKRVVGAPARRTTPTRTAPHARRRRARRGTGRSDITQAVAEAFATAFRVHDGWYAAGRPQLTKHEHDALKVAVHVLIDTLDAIEGDPDDEPILGAAEPSSYGPMLRSWDGVVRTMCDQTEWAASNTDDREEDPADGPEGDDEREGAETDDNGIGDGGGAWEQYGSNYGVLGFTVQP